jgi:hypothetical protein
VDRRAPRHHRVLQQVDELGRGLPRPGEHRLQRAVLLDEPLRRVTGQPGGEVAGRSRPLDEVERAVHEHLACARGGELVQGLAHRDLAVGVGGLAARRRRDRDRLVAGAADRVHVDDAELGRRQLDHDVDAGSPEPVQERARGRVGQAVDVDDDALVHRAEGHRVAVPLQHLEQRVRGGVLGVKRRALAVGDDGREQPPGGGAPGRSAGELATSSAGTSTCSPSRERVIGSHCSGRCSS